MKRNLMGLLTCVLATGLIAAGCGDDDDNNGDGGDALSKEDFLAQGNEICSEGNAELEASGGPAGNDQASLDAFVTDTLVPSIQGQIDDLRDLSPPEEDEDAVTAALDDAEGALGEIEADPSQLADTTFDDVNQQLTAIGLTECAT